MFTLGYIPLIAIFAYIVVILALKGIIFSLYIRVKDEQNGKNIENKNNKETKKIDNNKEKDKEKIKIIKDTVDVLTMTATPIPRTMNMSLSGVRDMSVIYEPPYNRLPIKTYIIEKDMEIIREAIYKEVERGGQVFYVYNRVEFIENTLNELKKELPKIEIDYAHGKMTPKQIEKKMKDFVENKTKVLVCTTILESGIDIPNANTIIIEDGDKLRTCTIISNER